MASSMVNGVRLLQLDFSVMMRNNKNLVVFRSQPFNLRLNSNCPLAVQAIIALLQWIKSGNGSQDMDSTKTYMTGSTAL